MFKTNNNKRYIKNKNTEKHKNRIAKHLSILGVASKREAEKLITENKVKINGILCNDLSTLIGYDDKINVNGKDIINKPIKTSIYIMNKPKGCITSNNDPQGRKTIFEFIPSKFGRLITIGRLDFNTDGLILLTNNGELARLMEMPASQIKRVYFVKVIGDIKEDLFDKLKNLKNGIKIEGTEYGKMIVDIHDYSKTKATFRITIFEGKNNEIRRVMWFFGLKVVKLTRVQYGDFKLQGLPSGCIKESYIKIDMQKLERRINENIKKYNQKQNNKSSNVNYKQNDKNKVLSNEIDKNKNNSANNITEENQNKEFNKTDVNFVENQTHKKEKQTTEIKNQNDKNKNESSDL